MNSFERGVRRAYEIYNNRDHYCYLYGAKGVKLTKANFEYFVKKSPSHFSKYTQKQLDDYFIHNVGKIALDCSGFVAECFDFVPARSSTGYYANKDVEFKDYTESVGGALLYTTFNGTGRHIGIDVGSGYFIHSASELRGICLDKFSDCPSYWEHCFTLKGVDYEGASARSIYNKS